MRKVLSIILITILIISANQGLSVSAYQDSDISNEICEQLNACGIEYGLNTSFEYRGDGNALCQSIIEEISKGYRVKAEWKKDEELSNIQINNEEINGYIQCVKNNRYHIIEIELKSSRKSNLDVIRGVISNKLENKNVKIKYFTYVKSKLSNGDVKSIYNQVSMLLKNKGAKNIESVKLDSGYSITAFTNCGETIENMRKLIDINIAILSYKSGNYMIIGTPEIMTAY